MEVQVSGACVWLPPCAAQGHALLTVLECGTASLDFDKVHTARHRKAAALWKP